MNKLVIVGAGGHGKVIADAAEKSKKYKEIIFLDDNLVNQTILGFEVIDRVENANCYLSDYEFVVGIGDNKIRKLIQNQLESMEAKIATIIHPSAIIGKNVIIQEGSVIFAGVVINVDTVIGKGSIINTSASVDHDCIIGNYTHISPGVNIAGSVSIGNLCWIGVGSSIQNDLSIGSKIIIGSHSNVINNHLESGLYFGNPVRFIKNENSKFRKVVEKSE